MTREELIQEIKRKKSFLCIGLDPDLTKIPAHLLKEEDPIFAFNKAIIDATHDLAVAYKPNTAFYECHGSKGWETLQKTIEYLKFYEEITKTNVRRSQKCYSALNSNNRRNCTNDNYSSE
jgi:orotidine-5'-phosphate decarboxylase